MMATELEMMREDAKRRISSSAIPEVNLSTLSGHAKKQIEKELMQSDKAFKSPFWLIPAVTESGYFGLLDDTPSAEFLEKLGFKVLGDYGSMKEHASAEGTYLLVLPPSGWLRDRRDSYWMYIYDSNFRKYISVSSHEKPRVFFESPSIRFSMYQAMNQEGFHDSFRSFSMKANISSQSDGIEGLLNSIAERKVCEEVFLKLYQNAFFYCAMDRTDVFERDLLQRFIYDLFDPILKAQKKYNFSPDYLFSALFGALDGNFLEYPLDENDQLEKSYFEITADHAYAERLMSLKEYLSSVKKNYLEMLSEERPTETGMMLAYLNAARIFGGQARFKADSDAIINVAYEVLHEESTDSYEKKLARAYQEIIRLGLDKQFKDYIETGPIKMDHFYFEEKKGNGLSVVIEGYEFSGFAAYKNGKATMIADNSKMFYIDILLRADMDRDLEAQIQDMQKLENNIADSFGHERAWISLA